MDAEAAPRELELSALEAEKEPMAAAEPGTPPEPPAPHRDPVPGPEPRPGGEKNGLVMKIPPEEEEEAALRGAGASGSPKFTGLGKEELLREAGMPLWARARMVLLVLFWGGWLGMLGAAAAIVAQAPRCQPLPAKAWCGEAFGVPEGQAAGLKVILDLTPNPSGDPVWEGAGADPVVHQQVQAALSHWLKEDIAGIFLDGIDELEPSVVAEWRNLTEQQPSPSGVEAPELELCATLAPLRARERSLLLGEAGAVPARSGLAVLRRWDQSERYLWC
ncbi:hypothetical protein DUI87_00253 [Hirundo rustica rustica]|uniref:Solute carrier family 3 member 2 N-terminal domain-containing protein n=1 Tax=Hirundo rustica rustica TaxID=333673 RepID=A0A3M0LIQ7_HIRRU|nr:hypothetical protein DUI87_00253 [Hirundo rustica rustica]